MKHVIQTPAALTATLTQSQPKCCRLRQWLGDRECTGHNLPRENKAPEGMRQTRHPPAISPLLQYAEHDVCRQHGVESIQNDITGRSINKQDHTATDLRNQSLGTTRKPITNTERELILSKQDQVSISVTTRDGSTPVSF